MDFITAFINGLIDMVTFVLAGFGLFSLVSIIWSEIEEEEEA